jgi:hypothetical protein
MVVESEYIKDVLSVNACVQAIPPAGTADLAPAVNPARGPIVPVLAVAELTLAIYSVVKSTGLTTDTENPVSGTSQLRLALGLGVAVRVGVKLAKVKVNRLLVNAAVLIGLVIPLSL